MEQNSVTLLEDVRHDRSAILFLSLADPDKLKQSKYMDQVIYTKKIVL